MKSSALLLLVSAVWLVSSGCEEVPDAPEPLNVRYEGELRWDWNGLDVVGDSGIDTVILIIRGGNYTYFHRTRKDGTSDVDGIVTQFRTEADSVVFSATLYACPACDTIGTLNGTFAVRYVNDSLYLTGHRVKGGRPRDWDYRLVQVAQ